MKPLIDSLLEPDEVAFRDQLIEFCHGWEDRADHLQYFRGRGATTRQIYTELGDRRWLSLTWPKEDGGAGLAPIYDYLVWDTLAFHRLARPDIGSGLVAHGILLSGSPEQKARWLPGLAAGRSSFALGYSEPGAGSDLTGLATRARREGNQYVVRGEKCWTSDAHTSDYLWALCRTGRAEDRSKGLTMLVIDLRLPGVDVQPIPTIDGHRLNQVFLEDVVVPVSDRVGPEGGAWSMIRAILAVERHLQLLPGRLRRDLEDLDARLRPDGGSAGPVADNALDELWYRFRQVEASSIATVATMTGGGTGAADAARTRLLGGILAQDVARTGMDLLGPAACVADDTFSFLWKQSFMETIAGGSSEMMLNILARQSLGLSADR